MSEPEPETREVTVTCRTEDCDNAGHGIVLLVPTEPATPNVVCGVCSQPITDIT